MAPGPCRWGSKGVNTKWTRRCTVFHQDIDRTDMSITTKYFPTDCPATSVTASMLSYQIRIGSYKGFMQIFCVVEGRRFWAVVTVFVTACRIGIRYGYRVRDKP